MMEDPLHPQEEEEDFAHVPFDDDEEEEDQRHLAGSGAPNDDSLLQLSLQGGGAEISGLDTSGLLLSSGLDDSREEPDTAGNKRAAEGDTKRKRRKRRKIVVDNNSTELSTDHIRAMLSDTSDIVKRQVHPADITDDDDEEKRGNAGAAAKIVPILTQPFLADDGHLHPILAGLWRENFYGAMDQPCPFEKLDDDDVEQARKAAPFQDNEEEASQSDMEDQQRHRPNNNGDDSQMMMDEEEDFPAPELDDEEEEDMAPILDDSEEDEVHHHHRRHGDSELGDLGLVNELQIDSEDEEDEENREAVGEHTGTTKWHKHTVKVLKLLQSRIQPSEGGSNLDQDHEAEAKPTSLEFGELAKNVNRRTAASCFMECLQLKTWDFIDLAQDDEYGPIVISGGPRFQEAPPNDA